VDTPGVQFTPTPVTGVFSVEIAPDAEPGPHLVRFFNEEGASVPRFFIVSTEPESRETEPNDEFRMPQNIAGLPATVGGRLDKSGDVDCFAVSLKKGQTLVAWLEAFVLASTFDGMLRIVDSNGVQYAFNHDGRTFDPFLAWEAPRDGTFVVQVMGFVHPANNSEQFTGGEGCIYRLHLTAGPYVRYTVPLAAKRGEATPVRLVGWNLTTSEAVLDGSQPTPDPNAAALPVPGIGSDQLVAVSDLPEAIEKEAPGMLGNTEALTVPGAVTGCIQERNDEDRFLFTAVKQRAYNIQLTGARVGSPLDAWLQVEDSNREQLARSDDASGSRDPQLTWTAPSDGTFVIAVGDLTHRGGDDFVYRLAVTEAAPGVTAAIADHALKLQAGKTADLKVAVKRMNGFGAKLQLAAKNLPEGISAPEVEVPEKGGDVVLKVSATADAKPAGQAFQLVLRETEGGKEHPVRYSLVETTENNGVPQGYNELVIDSTDQLWLTVLTAPAK
jgi:hypothetical protein